MSLAIRGMGWVTPLGDEIDDVWRRLLAGEEATVETVSDPISARTYPAFRVSKVTTCASAFAAIERNLTFRRGRWIVRAAKRRIGFAKGDRAHRD